MVEILSVEVQKGIVSIQAMDVSEENLVRMERMRDDMFNSEIQFQFDTHEKSAFQYLRNWLKSQKSVSGSTTWGEALQAVVGTITTISGKYRNWA